MGILHYIFHNWGKQKIIAWTRGQWSKLLHKYEIQGNFLNEQVMNYIFLKICFVKEIKLISGNWKISIWKKEQTHFSTLLREQWKVWNLKSHLPKTLFWKKYNKLCYLTRFQAPDLLCKNKLKTNYA